MIFEKTNATVSSMSVKPSDTAQAFSSKTLKPFFVAILGNLHSLQSKAFTPRTIAPHLVYEYRRRRPPEMTVWLLKQRWKTLVVSNVADEVRNDVPDVLFGQIVFDFLGGQP